MNKYKILMCDCDGTLLGSDRTISEKNKRLIGEFVSRGGIFVPITGRTVSSTREIALEAGARDLAVTYQGGLVFDVRSGKTVHAEGIDVSMAAEVCDYFEKNDEHVNLFIDDTVYMNKDDEYTAEYREINGGEIVFFDGASSEFVRRQNGVINKILVMTEYGRVAETIDLAKVRFKERLEICSSAYNYIEITEAKTNKGRGMAFISEYYGVPLGEIAAIGDSMNDRHMIRNAGLGIAMGNACEEIKRLAKVIVPVNDDDGVGYAIEKYIL